jgi:hypothetical protein
MKRRFNFASRRIVIIIIIIIIDPQQHLPSTTLSDQ